MSSESKEIAIMDILRASFPEANDIQFTSNSNVDRNQHYTSDIKYLSVNYKREHENHQIDVIIKIPKRRQQSSFYEKLHFFMRETSMYGEMLPLVHQSLDYFLAPLHYHTVDSRIFVLEDLSRQGYECRDRKDFLNLEQCYPVLKTLSHFHAASHKIHQTHPHLLSELPFHKSAAAAVRRNVASSRAPLLLDLLRKKGDTNLVPKFANAVSFLNQDDDIICPIIEQSNFDFVVLNHGDFRISNLLFKYSSKDTIESVKIIDFQTCMWSSPAADLIYFLTLSVQMDTVREHFHTLVDWYLQCLNGQLRDLECAQTYTKDQFMEDFNKLKFFTLKGVMSACSMISPMDLNQFETIFMLDKKEKTSCSHVSLEDERFVYIIYGWLKFYEQMGVFDVDKLGTGATRILQ